MSVQKIISSLTLVFVLSLISTFVSAQIYLQDDFSGGMSKWVSLWGNWDIQDGALHQGMIDDNCMAVVADGFWQEEWTEYTMELKAKKLSGNEGFLIMFRLHGAPMPRARVLRALPPRMQGQSPMTEYWWNIGGWGNTRTVIERWIGGVRIEQGLVAGTHGVKLNQWHNIKIENRADGYSVYFDGKELAAVADPDVEGGRIGLATWATEALFDDLVVYGPGGPTAIAPADKLPTSWGSIKSGYYK